LLLSHLLLAKKKKSDFDSNKNGNLTLHFDNRAGSSDLVLSSTAYKNSFNEDLTFTKFDYYISNIKLTKEDGSIYTLPKDNSYFLVKESDATTQDIRPFWEFLKITIQGLHLQ
jgi:hypothetical protein